jgi:hypothetical protein
MARVDEAVETYRADRGGRGTDERPSNRSIACYAKRSPRRPALALRAARRAREHGAEDRSAVGMGTPRRRGVWRRRSARWRSTSAFFRCCRTTARLCARSRGCSARRATRRVPQTSSRSTAIRGRAPSASREVEIARLLCRGCGQACLKRLAACERALQLSPNDPRAIGRGRAAPADARDPGSRSGPSSSAVRRDRRRPKQAEVLEVLIGTTAARDDRLALYYRLADVHERKLEDPKRLSTSSCPSWQASPHRAAVWDRLAALAP